MQVKLPLFNLLMLYNRQVQSFKIEKDELLSWRFTICDIFLGRDTWLTLRFIHICESALHDVHSRELEIFWACSHQVSFRLFLFHMNFSLCGDHSIWLNVWELWNGNFIYLLYSRWSFFCAGATEKWTRLEFSLLINHPASFILRWLNLRRFPFRPSKLCSSRHTRTRLAMIWLTWLQQWT